MKKNILLENMRRFGTKNLTEQGRETDFMNIEPMTPESKKDLDRMYGKIYDYTEKMGDEALEILDRVIAASGEEDMMQRYYDEENIEDDYEYIRTIFSRTLEVLADEAGPMRENMKRFKTKNLSEQAITPDLEEKLLGLWDRTKWQDTEGYTQVVAELDGRYYFGLAIDYYNKDRNKPDVVEIEQISKSMYDSLLS